MDDNPMESDNATDGSSHRASSTEYAAVLDEFLFFLLLFLFSLQSPTYRPRPSSIAPSTSSSLLLLLLLPPFSLPTTLLVDKDKL